MPYWLPTVVEDGMYNYPQALSQLMAVFLIGSCPAFFVNKVEVVPENKLNARIFGQFICEGFEGDLS